MLLVTGARGAGRLRAVAGARARPRRAALRAAAAVVGRHRHRGDGADLPADVPARPDRHRSSASSLVLTGGLLPAAIFILKDFMDAMPRSYEESARVFGASPLQMLRHVVLPIARPGLATIAVWTIVQGVGQLPDRRSSCCATRTSSPAGGAHVHLLHRGRAAPNLAAHLDVLAAVLDPGGRRCTCSSTAATASASMEGSRADGRHRPRRALQGVSRWGRAPSTSSTCPSRTASSSRCSGPSGCGKTTLLRTIAGLEEATVGPAPHRRHAT